MGEQVYEVYERDDGFVTGSPGPATDFAEFDNWSPSEQKAMDFAQGRVLDIGCGAGRHALYLQERGFSVMGIEVSPLVVKVCLRRGLRELKACPITQVNSNLDTFDTLLMMGNNFGLFSNPRGQYGY